MYVHRQGARAWLEDAPQQFGPQRPPKPPPARTLWARLPWRGRLGRYVAVRLRGEKLEVGIAGNPVMQWVPAERALRDSEAERWARIGF